MKNCTTLTLCLLIVGFVSSSAIAADFVGVTSGFVPGSAPLVKIDAQSGTYSTITTQARAYEALAQNSSGQLFGAWFSGSGDNGRVSQIDSATGAMLQTFNAITPGAGSTRGLAFDAADQLFAVVNRNDASGSPTLPDDLYTFDLATQTTTLIGSLGFNSVQGLDISIGGTLYAWDVNDGLLTVDSTTGNASDVNPSIGGTFNIQSIAFAPDGTLFGASENLFSIDLTTGAFTQIGTGIGLDVRGIEFVVPEPTPLALTLPLFLASLFCLRRR